MDDEDKPLTVKRGSFVGETVLSPLKFKKVEGQLYTEEGNLHTLDDLMVTAKMETTGGDIIIACWVDRRKTNRKVLLNMGDGMYDTKLIE